MEQRKFTGLTTACALLLAITSMSHSAPPPREGGIWKAVVPPGHMKAEFDGFDPIGVAAGHRIQADCSLNWVSPDNGARYCFSSGTSLEFFLERPQEYIKRARENWDRMHQ